MAETYLSVGTFNPIKIRLDPTDVRAAGTVWRPILRFPLKVQILPLQESPDYTLTELSCSVTYHPLQEIARIQMSDLVEDSSPQAYDRPLDLDVAISPQIAARMEEARDGKDPCFSLAFAGRVWLWATGKFGRAATNHVLDVRIPRSTWADQVLQVWKLAEVKFVEIRFVNGSLATDLALAHRMIEGAERHYANGHYREVLAEIFAAFESFAKARGFSRPDQQFFVSVLSEMGAAKKEKAKLMLDGICGFLQLGRHEANPPTIVTRDDARLMLIFASAIVEYFSNVPR